MIGRESFTAAFALSLCAASAPAHAADPVPAKPTPPQQAGRVARTSPLAYIGFGVAGAAAATGLISGYIALSSANDAEAGCTGNRCPPETHDDIDRGRTMATISTISFIVAGAGVAVGVYGLSAGDGVRPEEPNVGLFIGPGGGGLRGQF